MTLDDARQIIGQTAIWRHRTTTGVHDWRITIEGVTAARVRVNGPDGRRIVDPDRLRKISETKQ